MALYSVKVLYTLTCFGVFGHALCLNLIVESAVKL